MKMLSASVIYHHAAHLFHSSMYWGCYERREGNYPCMREV